MTMKDSKKIELILVDDHSMVREGLKVVLRKYQELEVVGEAGTGEDALKVIEDKDPQVALVDVRLPDFDGIEVCRKALASGASTHFIMLTSFLDEDMILRAIHAGAQGYLLKEIDPEGLYEAICKVMRGESALPPQVAQQLMKGLRHDKEEQKVKSRLELISPQEHRVMELVAAGRINKEIADEMNLSEKTVKNYLSTIFTKLDVSRRAQVAAIYTEFVRKST